MPYADALRVNGGLTSIDPSPEIIFKIRMASGLTMLGANKAPEPRAERGDTAIADDPTSSPARYPFVNGALRVNINTKIVTKILGVVFTI